MYFYVKFSAGITVVIDTIWLCQPSIYQVLLYQFISSVFFIDTLLSSDCYSKYLIIHLITIFL